MSKLSKYVAISPIKAGREITQPGETVELDKESAAPLLKLGRIAKPGDAEALLNPARAATAAGGAAQARVAELETALTDAEARIAELESLAADAAKAAEDGDARIAELESLAADAAKAAEDGDARIAELESHVADLTKPLDEAGTGGAESGGSGGLAV